MRPAYLTFALLVACGGATASASPTATATATATPTATPTATATATPTPPLPTRCADPSAPFCTPPGAFVDRLCAKPRQDATLALFARTTPFTRVYLRGRLDELVFDEEVLVLRVHAPQKGGMVVGSGNGSYDVLRWDGTCAAGVEAEMITRTRPPRPRTARVKWHRIGSRMQDALIAASDAVKRAHARRGKECGGTMTGEVSAACERADQGLVDAIVDCVRTSDALSEPTDF